VKLPKNLPNLPKNIEKIQLLFGKDEVDMVEFSSIIEKDSILSANILKLVNSPFYALKTKVSSIHQATTLLGTTILRGIIMAVVLRKNFSIDLNIYGITQNIFDEICFSRVKFGNLWIKDKKDIDIKNTLSALFLMENGKILMIYWAMQENITEKFKKLIKAKGNTKAEIELFGMDRYLLASILFKKWMFDKNFTDMIKGTLSPETKEQRILKVIITLINTKSILGKENIKKALKLVEIYQMNCDHFLQSINQMKAEIS